MRSVIFAVSASLAALSAVSPTTSKQPSVVVSPLPDAAGIQPQAVAGVDGQVHVVYFKGEASGGDLYYIRNGSQPLRVNSIAESALATGSIRGAQLALGRDGRVHIAWHGSKAGHGKGHLRTRRCESTRSTPDGLHFDPQRAVSGPAEGLDGGAVAADRSGHVVVAWHAMGDRPGGEGNRTVYLARSSDDGATFSPEAPATSAPLGACGCCGMRALFDRRGTLHVLYRAATDGRHRDTTWLRVDGATARPPVRVHPWELEACPMTTYALAETPDGLAAAWETAEQIYSATLNSATGTVSQRSAMPGTGSRKHPSIAVNAAGDRLVAWTEGTAWKRGGTKAWRLSDRNGVQLAAAPNAGPVPVWGLVSAVAMPDGSLVIIR